MIDIEDNVPMPDDGWTSKPAKYAPPYPDAAKDPFNAVKGMNKPSKIIVESNADAKGGWVKDAFLEGIEAKTAARFNPPQPGPNDCTFIGGPLNGKFGPLKDNRPKVVEIELYAADGSVSSVELYALGDTHPTPTFRYHLGSKSP